jgi:hypothetical protein
VLFPAELVIFVAHHNFGSDIRLEFVDLLLFGNFLFVRVRVWEETVDTEVSNRISLGEG